LETTNLAIDVLSPLLGLLLDIEDVLPPRNLGHNDTLCWIAGHPVRALVPPPVPIHGGYAAGFLIEKETRPRYAAKGQVSPGDGGSYNDLELKMWWHGFHPAHAGRLGDEIGPTSGKARLGKNIAFPPTREETAPQVDQFVGMVAGEDERVPVLEALHTAFRAAEFRRLTDNVCHRIEDLPKDVEPGRGVSHTDRRTQEIKDQCVLPTLLLSQFENHDGPILPAGTHTRGLPAIQPQGSIRSRD